MRIEIIQCNEITGQKTLNIELHTEDKSFNSWFIMPDDPEVLLMFIESSINKALKLYEESQ